MNTPEGATHYSVDPTVFLMKDPFNTEGWLIYDHSTLPHWIKDKSSDRVIKPLVEVGDLVEHEPTGKKGIVIESDNLNNVKIKLSDFGVKPESFPMQELTVLHVSSETDTAVKPLPEGLKFNKLSPEELEAVINDHFYWENTEHGVIFRPVKPLIERELSHISDRRSMGKTVKAFNAITGHNLTEEEGWLFMENLKQVSDHAGLRGECAARDRG